MKVREWEGEIIFLHQVIDGAADRSYGVHVARLAGLPAGVISRAQALLTEMESGGHGVIDAGRLVEDLPLFDHDFSATKAQETGMDRSADMINKDDAVRARLTEINPDMLAPREALDLLYELRDLISDTQKGQ